MSCMPRLSCTKSTHPLRPALKQLVETAFEIPRAADEPAAPQLVPPGREPVAPGDRPEMARVDADLLDQLLNVSGEVSISRAAWNSRWVRSNST